MEDELTTEEVVADTEEDASKVEEIEEDSDVTEESSDDEAEVVLVQRTNSHGDAYAPASNPEHKRKDHEKDDWDTALHKSIPKETVSAKAESEKGIEIYEEVEERSDTGEITEEKVGSIDSDVETEVRLIKETEEIANRVTENRDETVIEVNESTDEDSETEVKRLIDRDNVEDETLAEEIEGIAGIDETIATEATENTADETVEGEEIEGAVAKDRKRKPRRLPLEPQRRSDRTRKLPERYDQYVMYGMDNRPYDSRIQALQAVMSSGVLGKMDIELARKVINAIMK